MVISVDNTACLDDIFPSSPDQSIFHEHDPRNNQSNATTKPGKFRSLEAYMADEIKKLSKESSTTEQLEYFYNKRRGVETVNYLSRLNYYLEHHVDELIDHDMYEKLGFMLTDLEQRRTGKTLRRILLGKSPTKYKTGEERAMGAKFELDQLEQAIKQKMGDYELAQQRKDDLTDHVVAETTPSPLNICTPYVAVPQASDAKQNSSTRLYKQDLEIGLLLQDQEIIEAERKKKLILEWNDAIRLKHTIPMMVNPPSVYHPVPPKKQIPALFYEGTLASSLQEVFSQRQSLSPLQRFWRMVTIQNSEVMEGDMPSIQKRIDALYQGFNIHIKDIREIDDNSYKMIFDKHTKNHNSHSIMV